MTQRKLLSIISAVSLILAMSLAILSLTEGTIIIKVAKAEPVPPFIKVTAVRNDGFNVLKNYTQQNVYVYILYNASAVGKKLYSIQLKWDPALLHYETFNSLEAYYNGGWQNVNVAVEPNPAQGTLKLIVAQSDWNYVTANESKLVWLRVSVSFTPIASSNLEVTSINVSATTDDGTLTGSDTIYIDAEKPEIVIELPGGPMEYNTSEGQVIEAWVMPNATNLTIMLCDNYGIARPIASIISIQGISSSNYIIYGPFNASPTWSEAGKEISKCWEFKVEPKTLHDTYFNLSVSVSDVAGFSNTASRNWIYIDTQKPSILIETEGTFGDLRYITPSENNIIITISDNYGWTLSEAQSKISILINKSQPAIVGEPKLVEITNTTMPNAYGRYTEIRLVYQVNVTGDGYINISATINDLSGQTGSAQLDRVYVVKTPPRLENVEPINATFHDFPAYINNTGYVLNITLEQPILALLGSQGLPSCSIKEAYLGDRDIAGSLQLTIQYLGEDYAEVLITNSTPLFTTSAPFNITLECSDFTGNKLPIYLVYINDVELPKISEPAITPAINTGSGIATNSTPIVKINITDNYLFNMSNTSIPARYNNLEYYLGGNIIKYFRLFNITKINDTTLEITLKPIQPLSDGRYSFELIVNDNAPEHDNKTSTMVEFIVDTKPPTITLLPDQSSPDHGRIYVTSNTEWYIASETSRVDVCFEVTDPLLDTSSIKAYVNGTETPITQDGCYTVRVDTSIGTVFNITIEASDLLGHTSSYTLIVKKDTEPPVIQYTMKKIGVDASGNPAAIVLEVSVQDNIEPNQSITITAASLQASLNLTQCAEHRLYAYSDGNLVNESSLNNHHVLDAIIYCGFNKIIINVTKLTESGPVSIDIEAKDYVGNTKTVQIGSFNTPNTEYVFYLVRLYGGWNLISLPAVTTIPVAQLQNYLLSGDLSKITAIYYYNENTASKWVPITGEDVLEHGKGYFVYVNAETGSLADVLVVGGTKHIVATNGQPGMPLSYDLNKGWNLVGFTAQKEMKPSKYFSSINESLVGVWAYDAETQSWKLVYHEALGDVGDLYPGLGYFIYLKSAAILIPPVARQPV